MEIKLTKSKPLKQEQDIPLKKAQRSAANAISYDVGTEAGRAITIQAKGSRVKRIAVLRCGIVYLQNFSEELSEPGRQLKLLREPDNPYDRWATKVCTLSGMMLGYLPAQKNQSVARLIDAGKNVTVFVDETFCDSSATPSKEDPRLPLILYMDIRDPKEE